jgi:RNA polymerase sigma factor (sigma-70 family)
MASRSANLLYHLRAALAEQDTAQLPDRQLLERFTHHQEEAAFTTLVRRHGPLVLGVCRRVLPNWHDAEDAFQATFLVLARKADSICKTECVGTWLYQVAYRVAVKARARTATRSLHERQASPSSPADPLAEVTGRELLAVLDEELHHLPERLLAPLMLCYLQGKTRDEATRQLGCSLSTLKRRLEQAKERLRHRLAQRGLALSAALLVTELAESAAPTAIAAPLLASTVQAALPFALGKTAATGLVAAPAVVLADAVLRAVLMTKLKLAAVLLTVGLAALSAVALVHQAFAPGPDANRAASTPPEQPKRSLSMIPAEKPLPPAARLEEPQPEAQEEMTVSGRVLDRDGEPVRDAAVAVVARPKRRLRGGDLSGEDKCQVFGQVKANDAGRFRLMVPRTSSAQFQELLVLAARKGYGLGWQQFHPDAEQPDAVLRLPPEQVIRGRLLDLQGQPAAGVRVHLAWVGQLLNGEVTGIQFWNPPESFALWPGPVTTDQQGRFVIHGLNREQGVQLKIYDDRFARQWLQLPEKQENEVNLSLAPAQILEGRVLYEDSGQPVAHARLTVYATDDDFGSGSLGMDGQADAQGRFRFNPYPGNRLTVTGYAPDGQPYLIKQQELKWPKGSVKQAVEVKLPRGVLVRGKVTEAPSGKPVEGASVQFLPRDANNPNRREDIVTGWQGVVLSGADGSFRMAVLPGPGHLLLRGPTLDYIHEEVGNNVLYNGKPGGQRYYPDGLIKLDIPPRTDTQEVAVTLRRGVPVKGRLLSPEGQPVARALMFCRLHVAYDFSWRYGIEVHGARFELRGLDPEKSYPVYFLDPENHWGASVTLSGKQTGESVTVQLLPCGKATARFVDLDGKPLANFCPHLHMVITPGAGRFDRSAQDKGLLLCDGNFLANLDRRNYWNGPRADTQGRCTFPALIPGATYRLDILENEKRDLVAKKEFTVEAGKTLELGDIRIQPQPE